MAKTLRIRTRDGWVTKPPADLPENRLRAEEVDDNFLELADDTQAGLTNKVDKVEGKQLSANDYTDAEKQKLGGVADGATANASDAQLRDRSTHTGTQAASTITGLGSAATKDVAATGNASATQVVKGDDARLSDARAPTAHTHTASEITDLPTIPEDVLRSSDVVDGLASTDAGKPLSANQGRELNTAIELIQSLLQSDDSTLDDLQEIVSYIKINRSELQNLTIGAISGLRSALDAKATITSVDELAARVMALEGYHEQTASAKKTIPFTLNSVPLG